MFLRSYLNSYYRDNLLHLLKEGYPTPFNSLRQLTHLVSSYAYNTVKLPDMHWNLQRDTLSVKGYPLQINLIPKMVQTLCSKANDILAQLLLGINASAFDRVIDTALQPNDRAGWPVDPLRNTDVGFSFVHSPDNAFQSHLDMILEHIYSTPSVFQIYHTKDKEGHIIHKPSGSFLHHLLTFAHLSTAALRNYLCLHHEFIDLLMTLAHTTTPGAARGTELGPLRAVNSIDGPRNFFFLAGSCAIICQYLKTRSNTGRDGFVAHFLPTAVARLFIYLIGPIRQVVIAFARQVSSENIHVYEAYLYVVNGKTVESSAFSNILRLHTQEFLCVPLTLAPYRQAIKAILRSILHHHHDLDVPDDAIDACFGHSSSTGNTQYGLVYDDLPGLTENMYVDALRLASRYHDWLGLGSSSDPSDSISTTPSESHRVLEPVLRRLQQVLPALEATRDHSCDLVTIENNILERCLPIIQDTISTTLSHKVPWTSHLRISPSHPSSNTEPILVHPSRLSYLSALFRRQNTHFKSISQGQAIEIVAHMHPHALVVLPTGGGKSAVYQTPCFSADSGFRVVIIPYVSLMDQALADASAKSIPHSIWSLSDCVVNPFRDKLVFAAAEHVATESFREWLHSSYRAGYLNGIVVDEAHDILLSQNYRETFCSFTCLGHVGCQIVLLSATVGPSNEAALWRVSTLPIKEFSSLALQAAGIDTQRQPIHVIRQSTARPDIQFLVTHINNDRLFEFTVRVISHHAFQSTLDRGIVFCEYVDDAKSLAEHIGAPFYIGKMDAESRSTAQNRWRSGSSKWICATSAFAQGIDYGHVTYVLHFRIPKHMTLHAQQSGRLARRDGVVGVSHLIYSDPPLHQPSSEVDLGGFNAMLDFATKPQCRRLSISAFFDSNLSNCTMISPCELCDFCSRDIVRTSIVLAYFC